MHIAHGYTYDSNTLHICKLLKNIDLYSGTCNAIMLFMRKLLKLRVDTAENSSSGYIVDIIFQPIAGIDKWRSVRMHSWNAAFKFLASNNLDDFDIKVYDLRIDDSGSI